MKFVTLTPSQEAALRALHKNSPSHRERQRAQAVLLSARGYTLDQLAGIFECDRDTVSGWLEMWHQREMAALADAAKSGRPHKLSPQAQQQVLCAVASPSPNFKALVLDELKRGV